MTYKKKDKTKLRKIRVGKTTTLFIKPFMVKEGDLL
jgi:hypothetical protein